MVINTHIILIMSDQRPIPTISLPMYLPGCTVRFQGRSYVINFVTLANYQLYINLHGYPDRVSSELIELDPTVIYKGPEVE